jgi:hypothetical protein
VAAAASSERRCGRWIAGKCARGKLKTGADSPKGICHRRHAFDVGGNELVDSLTIDCDLGDQCHGTDCPYRHPVGTPPDPGADPDDTAAAVETMAEVES